jgi:hypothetical protein
VTAMKKDKILEYIKSYKVISIVGMDKNVGKTTTLNYVIEKTRGIFSLGLTSVGVDGESRDVVTGTNKPRIYVPANTVIATAKQCFLKSDITLEVLESTSFSTPLGNVIIGRALSEGHVELAGPSINSQMIEISSRLKELGAELVLIDGALSRKSTAVSELCDGVILATGAALSNKIDYVVNETVHRIQMLSLHTVDDKEIIRISNDFKEEKIILINRDYTHKSLNVSTSLSAYKEILENINGETMCILIRGIITEKLLLQIINSGKVKKDITIIAENGTKLFISSDIFYRYLNTCGKIKVLNSINVFLVTCNPCSPSGYHFDNKEFIEKLQKKINLPVLNILGGD